MERRVGWDDAERWASDMLASAGVEPAHAGAIAWGMCEAQAIGVDTHGIVRVLHYLETLRACGVNPVPSIGTLTDTPAMTLIDADGGYGYEPMRLLVDDLVRKSGDIGIAFGGVRNSHHFGAASIYASRMARKGRVAFVLTNATANLAAPSATRPVIGNNPIAVAVPGPVDRGPVCVDIAMSHVAFGKIRLAARRGEAIPEGWARDEYGETTTDAVAAVRAGLLEALGDHKGFALAALIEIIAGAMTGSPFGTESKAHGNPAGGVGHFAVSIDPEGMVGLDVLTSRVERLAEELIAASRPGNPQCLPGYREERHRREAEEQGLVIPEDVVDMLRTASERAGVPFDLHPALAETEEAAK